MVLLAPVSYPSLLLWNTRQNRYKNAIPNNTHRMQMVRYGALIYRPPTYNALRRKEQKGMYSLPSQSHHMRSMAAADTVPRQNHILPFLSVKYNHRMVSPCDFVVPQNLDIHVVCPSHKILPVHYPVILASSRAFYTYNPAADRMLLLQKENILNLFLRFLH